MLKIQIILGSTREGRQGEKVAKWVYEQAKEHKDIEVELVDLRDYPLPFYEEPTLPIFLQGKYKNPVAKQWAEKVAEADAYIIVTPEYNRSFPAVLKNALDYVYSEWNKKPVAFVSYGGSANGARAVEQLRQVIIELQMAPVRSSVHFAMRLKPFDEQGNLQEQFTQHYSQLLSALLGDLIWWGKVLKEAREKKE